MKYSARISILSVLLVSCIGCSLDMRPDGRLTYDQLFSNPDRTQKYFNGCLDYITSTGFTFDETLRASFCDEAEDSRDHVDGAVMQWYNGYTTTLNNPIEDVWTHYFNGIRMCSNIITNMSGNIDRETDGFIPARTKGWIAECYAIRAFCYLQLVKRYGGVPIIAEAQDKSHDYSNDTRCSFEECTDQIISDCRKALELRTTGEDVSSGYGLRWTVGNTTEPTCAFVYAVMSQAVLYAASPLWYEKGSRYTWDYATDITKEALDECLKNGFELYRSNSVSDAYCPYDQYFLIASTGIGMSNDKETIFLSSKRSSVWRKAGLPSTSGSEKAGPCPSQELVDSYEMDNGEPVLNLSRPYNDDDHLDPNYNPDSGYDPKNPYNGRDPRFYASIYYNGAQRYWTSNDNVTVETFVDENVRNGADALSTDPTVIRNTRTGYYLRKFNHHKSGVTSDMDGYMRVFRLAELYLNFAEAANNSKGPDTKIASGVSGSTPMSACEAVNAIRTRAGMPVLPDGMTQDEFGLRCRNERRVELAFEEHRFFDVRRWKILSVTDQFVTGMKAEVTGWSEPVYGPSGPDSKQVVLTPAAPLGFKYKRFRLEDRDCSEDKYLIYPVNQAEVDKMERLTGTSWQNPGW